MTLIRHLPAAAIVVTLLTTGQAGAQTKTYCSEPVTPFCANRAGVFENDAARDRCREEVRNYAHGMQTFIACLDKKQEEAAERSRMIDERFACMARGEDDCP